MQTNTQKYSNSTVFIVIAFLAIFIVMPPLCRLIYAEEEAPVVNAPVQDNNLAVSKLTCSKEYQATGIKIVSTSTYNDDAIVSNVIVFNNPNFLISKEGLEENAQKEFDEYSTLYSIFDTIPETNKAIAGDSVTVTIDKVVMNNMENKEIISSQMQDVLTLQNSYEVNGYTCVTE